MNRQNVVSKLVYLREKRRRYIDIIYYKSNYSGWFKSQVSKLLEEVEEQIRVYDYMLSHYDFINKKWRSI